MSALAAAPGPRFRVLGGTGAFVSYGLDPQEDALVSGRTPRDGTSWGLAEPPRSGQLVRGSRASAVPTLPGDYPAFYAAVERAVRSGGPMPVGVEGAAYVLDVLAAARESVRTGDVVTVGGPAGSQTGGRVDVDDVPPAGGQGSR
jgi:predicted dehydrogenase